MRSNPRRTERAESRRAYEAPALRPLGTLAELTLGGNVVGAPDGFGSSGDSGSITVGPTVRRITPGGVRRFP